MECVRVLVGKKRFQIKFKYEHTKEVSTSFLAVVSDEQEVGKGG